MILRRIEISGWRCFADRTSIGDFADGMTVLHAPNGTGKSTLFHALRRAMLDSHRSRGEDARALAPWGRDLAPRVAVDFSHGGAVYRIEKQFLKSPSSLLSRLENGRLAALADSDAADAQVRAMLLAEPSAKGLASRAEQFGLSFALWAPQGAIALDGSMSAGVSDRLRAALGAEAVGGAAGDAVTRAVESAYSSYFTPKGAEARGSPAVALRTRLDELRSQREAIDRQLTRFDDASRRVTELRGAREQADHDRRATATRLAAFRDDARRYAELSSVRRELEARAEQAHVEAARASATIDAVRAARHARSAAEAERARLRSLRSSVDAARQTSIRANDEAAASLARLRAARNDWRSAEAEADAAIRFSAATLAVADLDRRIARLAAIDAQVATLTAERQALRAPTEELMRTLRQADASLRTARAALEASLVVVRFTPARDSTIDIRLADQIGPIDAAAGGEVIVRGSPEVAFTLAGVGDFRASGPAGDAVTQREAVERAEARLAKLATPFGTADVETLQHRADAARTIDATLAATIVERDTIAGQANVTLETLRSERAAHAATRDTILAEHPDWAIVAPAADALREAWRSRRDDIEAAIAVAEQHAGIATDARRDAEVRSAEHETATASADRQLADAANALARAEAGEDDATRDRRRAEAALAWEAARTRAAEAAESIAAFDEDPAVAVARTERELAALDAQSNASIAEEGQAIGLLREIASGGSYTRLAELDEEIAATEADLGRATLHAAAIRLLRDTIAERRRQLIAAVSGPVEAIANDHLRRIAGRRLAAVRLDDRFAAEGLTIDPGTDVIAIDGLSGGEQEQAHLAVRLALAEVLSRQERQMVVLDDALVATDAGRLGKVRDVLEDVGQRCQIIVMTCHPERYRAMSRASFIDLSAAIAATDA